MRSIVLDEISSQDTDRLLEHLSEHLEASALSGVFWLPLPDDLLGPEQHGHAENCGPHRVALVVEEGSLRLELLIRAKNAMRCSCVDYASKPQRDFLMRWLDDLVQELGIQT